MINFFVFKRKHGAFKTLKFIGLLFVGVLLVSCADYDQFSDLEIESFSPEFGFPLINSKVSLEELLNIQAETDLSVIEVVNDNLIVKYAQGVNFEPVLILPSKTIHHSLPVLPHSFDVFFEDYAILGSDSEMKKLYLKEGTISVLFTKDFNEDVSISVRLPKLIKDGETAFFEANWENDSNSSEHLIDLAGSSMELFRVEGADTLYNSITYEIEISSDGGASGTLDVYIVIDSPRYEKMIGKIEFTGEIDEIDLQFDLLGSVTGDPYLFLENAFLELGIGTSFGIPFSLLLDTLIFENADDDIFFLANDDDLPPEGESWDHFLIGEKNYPGYAETDEMYAVTNLRLNNDNSNMDSLFAFLPNRLKMSGAYALGDFNPDDPVASPHDFFVLDTSSVYIGTRLEIPFSGVAMDMTLEYPIPLESWPDLEDDDMIQDFEIIMKTITQNNFPLTFSLQVDFLDDDGNILESLFDTENIQKIIDSPDVDANGDPVGFSELSFDVAMTKDKFNRISSATEANMAFRVVSPGATDRTVNLRPSQFIGIQMSLFINPTIGN